MSFSRINIKMNTFYLNMQIWAKRKLIKLEIEKHKTYLLIKFLIPKTTFVIQILIFAVNL